MLKIKPKRREAPFWLVLLIYTWLRIQRTSSNKQRLVWIHEVNSRRNALGEYHRLVQELRLDSSRFRQYFWMTQSIFDELLTPTGPLIAKKNPSWKEAIDPGQRLAITL